MTNLAIVDSEGLAVNVVTELDALEALRDEWAALCEECPRTTPFQHPDWVIPWTRHFVHGSLFTLAFRSGDGRLVGLAPWFRYVRSGERIVTSLGGGLSDHHEVIASPERSTDIVRAIFQTLGESTHAWDACELDQLGEGSPLLSASLPANLVEERRIESEPCPVLRLATSTDGKLSSVPGHQLAQFRKYRRRAERLGTLQLRRANADDCQEMLTTFFDLHAARWQSRHAAGMAADPLVRAFHREVTQNAARSGSLRLYALTLDGKAVASLYGFRDKNTLYCYWQGFDPSASELSPGMLIVGSVIEDAAREGATVVDFLRGLEPYKLRWGAVSERTYRLCIANGPRRSAATSMNRQ